jgi:glycosyltransferase involved in cell wall biosynthesis
LKVLHVNDVAYVAQYLVNGLTDLGVEAFFYQPTVGTYRATILKRFLMPITRTRESLHLRYLVKSQDIEIIHVHYASFAYMPMITGLPYILHCHGSDINRDLHRPGLRQLIIKALNRAQIVFCSTPNLVPLIKPYRTDVIFLPNPIDTNLFHPIRTDNTNIYQLLSISKLDRAKGINQIIDTIKLVWEMKPDAKIGMFSFGNEAEFIRDFQELNKSKLILLPFTKHDEMPNVINSYQAILGQQDMVGKALGVSELEAMASGKPVICPFGYSDYYQIPPPILQSNNAEEACNHALDLINDSEKRSNLGEKSREWILEQHSIETISQKLLKYYVSG